MEEGVIDSKDTAEASVKKKGYSIWSLMVIMTLVAVWLAVPRNLSNGIWRVWFLDLFIAAHQIVLWSMIASLIWIVSGKRRGVAYLLTVVVVLAWAPLLIVSLERACLHTNYALGLMYRIGLMQGLGVFYDSVTHGFGYEKPLYRID